MHNFKMYSDYLTLKDNDIDVYSVKTDAFRIGEYDVVKAKQLLTFGSEFGMWRVD